MLKYSLIHLSFLLTVLDTFSVRCQQRTMAALFSIFMSVGNSSNSSPTNKIPTMIKKKLRKKLGSLRKKKSRRSIFTSPSFEGRSSSSKSTLNISSRRSNYSSGVESSPGFKDINLTNKLIEKI